MSSHAWSAIRDSHNELRQEMSKSSQWRVHYWARLRMYVCIYRKQNFDIPTEFISTTLWDCINISMGPNLAQSMFCHVVDRFGLFHWSSENKQFWVESGDHRGSSRTHGREMIAVCVRRGQVWAVHHGTLRWNRQTVNLGVKISSFGLLCPG